ncbi:MAG: 5'-nucleotidase, lipoprotein e(P4) family [Bacteroidetes bacterium]|nr:5'-nucleotidase, lipoprotein e(P4) family [Bacteroidota bacterium]
MYRNILILIWVLILCISCKRVPVKKQDTTDTPDIIPASGVTEVRPSSSLHLEMAVLWYQRSAEMRAISYQTYNIARLLLDEKLKTIPDTVRPAVVVDVDETVLNNSPFEALLLKTGKKYNQEDWKLWIEKAEANPLPGSVEFLNYAISKEVEVFYISNRKDISLGQTLHNLKKFGFPNTENKYLLFRENDFSKEPRRKKVAEEYEILLFIGDNLADFTELYENRGTDLGFDVVDKHSGDFGSRFLIMPNPIYGDWEKAIYNYRKDLSEEERAKLRRSALEAFEPVADTMEDESYHAD